MKQERKYICHLFKCSWMVVLVSLLCWSVESTAFDYDDNIGFIKEVPANLKATYPTCDAFLNVQWSKPNLNPYETKKRVGPPPPEGVARALDMFGKTIWVGRTLVDVYEEDQKQRRGLVILMNSAREASSKEGVRLYPYLLPLPEYQQLEKGDPLRFFVQGDKEDVYMASQLGVTTMGKDDEPRWISEWLIDTRHYRFKKDGRYPARTLAHLTRNICYVSPGGGQGWLFEPSRPFVTETLLSADQKKQYQELLRLYAQDCPALMAQANLPPTSTGKPCAAKDSVSSYLRNGSQRDADGDGLLDYVFYDGGLDIIYFSNDRKPFIMLDPKECLLSNDGYYSINTDTEQLKIAQQCVAKAKNEYQRQSTTNQ